jgi:hypothetical protein
MLFEGNPSACANFSQEYFIFSCRYAETGTSDFEGECDFCLNGE